MKNAIEEEKVVMTADEASFIDRFVAEHCRPHAVVMAERLGKFVAERQMALFAADDGPAFALAAGPAAKTPAAVKAPDEAVTFVFASEGEENAPEAWRAELMVPPGATTETPRWFSSLSVYPRSWPATTSWSWIKARSSATEPMPNS